jgi:hypothetical protein
MASGGLADPMSWPKLPKEGNRSLSDFGLGHGKKRPAICGRFLCLALASHRLFPPPHEFFLIFDLAFSRSP